MRTSFGRRLRAAGTAIGMGLVVGLATVAANPAPAAAAGSGGGCGAWDPVDPCVSFTYERGGTLYGDFYANVNSYQHCYAQLGLYSNNVLRSSTGLIHLNRTGRIAGLSASVDNLPNTYNSGYARVIVYNCDLGGSYIKNSPKIYFTS